MDASWKKEASEDEIDSYIDVLYDEKDTSSDVRKAAMDLYLKLALKDVKDGKNTMVSPLSFFTAMGLLENGAKGATLEEIEKAFGLDIETFNKWYDAWSKMIMLNGGDTLKMANSVWYRADPTLDVSEDYLKKMAEIYEAQAFEAPFDQQTLNDINGWVNDNTDGMIPQVLDNISKGAMMFLINATCFEGGWLQKYEDDQIMEDQTFTRDDGTEDKAVMLSSTEDTYYENDYFTGTSKAYENGYNITFLLPKEGVALADAVENLDGGSLNDLYYNGEHAEVDLYIPEFGFDYKAPDCIGSLNDMGIETVFDENNADLSDMAVCNDGSNLFVNLIIHKTHVELDREGTKAAAATVIGIAKNTAMPMERPKREVRLDRPFAFIISDSQTNTPIFIGTVGSISE